MFEQILGNEIVKQRLKNAVGNNHLLHSYLFLGIEGIGKKEFAKEFAKNILCIKEKEPCKSCLAFEDGNHPEYRQIDPEEGKSIKIEQIRYMQEKIQEKPIISEKKVYVIDNAEKMTIEAQNSLLKTLEEPPEYAVIILITSNDSKLLNTIKSRCIKIPFQKIEKEELIKFYKQYFKEEPSESEIIACNGSIGKLIKNKENKEIYEDVENFINSIEQKDLIEVWKETEFFAKEKEQIQDILDYMSILLYNKKSRNYPKIIQTIGQTKQKLVGNSNFDMSIDYLIMKMWESVHENNSWS